LTEAKSCFDAQAFNGELIDCLCGNYDSNSIANCFIKWPV